MNYEWMVVFYLPLIFYVNRRHHGKHSDNLWFDFSNSICNRLEKWKDIMRDFFLILIAVSGLALTLLAVILWEVHRIERKLWCKPTVTEIKPNWLQRKIIIWKARLKMRLKK